MGIQAHQVPHEVWIQRCKELQDKEDGILPAREMQELKAKTRAMYGSAHSLNIHDNKLMQDFEATGPGYGSSTDLLPIKSHASYSQRPVSRISY
jgi:hypothetical protein